MMPLEIKDRNGTAVEIGDLVEVYEWWKVNPERKVGMVREITFKCGAEPTMKVRGVSNRGVPSEHVTKLELTEAEMTLVNAFIEQGVTPDIGLIRETLGKLR